MFDLDLTDVAVQRRSAAAQQRSASVAAATDRPARRSAEHAGSGSAVVFRSALEMRAPETDGGPLHFHGLASAYERGYEMFDFFGPYTEIVSRGAGAKSLARADLDVPLVLQHAQIRRIARTVNGTLALQETDEGLDVDAPNLDPLDHDVAYIAPKIRAGLIDEMSFAFRITRGEWSPDWTVYRIHEYEIHRGDVAIVGFGANPETISELRTPGVPELSPTAAAQRADEPAAVEEIDDEPFPILLG
jgi:HK97 family phage prohead protease